MPNFHPPLTGFPLALLTIVVVLELANYFRPLSLAQAGIKINLFATALFLALTFISGYQANEFANQTFVIGDDVIDQHHFFGKLLLFTFYPCLLCYIAQTQADNYREVFRKLYYLLLAVSFILTVYTGYLGGELVFGYGAGVRAVLHP